MKSKSIAIASLSILVFLACEVGANNAALASGEGVGVSLVADGELGAGARHGLGKVKAALEG